MAANIGKAANGNVPRVRRRKKVAQAWAAALVVVVAVVAAAAAVTAGSKSTAAGSNAPLPAATAAINVLKRGLLQQPQPASPGPTAAAPQGAGAQAASSPQDPQAAQPPQPQSPAGTPAQPPPAAPPPDTVARAAQAQVQAEAQAQAQAQAQAAGPPAAADSASVPPGTPQPPASNPHADLTYQPTGVALTLEEAINLGISDQCIANGARLFGGCSVEIAQAQRAFNLRGDVLSGRNYTGVLQARGVGRADVEQYIRTQLSFSAGCCRDACRFSYNLCGCEGGVVTLAMRLMGDETIFGVLLQQMGLACGFSMIYGPSCPDGNNPQVQQSLAARRETCSGLEASGTGTSTAEAQAAAAQQAAAAAVAAVAAAPPGPAQAPQTAAPQGSAPAAAPPAGAPPPDVPLAAVQPTAASLSPQQPQPPPQASASASASTPPPRGMLRKVLNTAHEPGRPPLF